MPVLPSRLLAGACGKALCSGGAGHRAVALERKHVSGRRRSPDAGRAGGADTFCLDVPITASRERRFGV